MEYYVGLDVSLKSTRICVMDKDRRVVWRGSVDTQPPMIAERLTRWTEELSIVGLETGSMTPWLYHGLKELHEASDRTGTAECETVGCGTFTALYTLHRPTGKAESPGYWWRRGLTAHRREPWDAYYASPRIGHELVVRIKVLTQQPYVENQRLIRVAHAIPFSCKFVAVPPNE